MKYSYIGDPSVKYFPAKKDGKCGYLNQDLEEVVPFIYDEVHPLRRSPTHIDFSYFLIKYWYEHTLVVKDGKLGVLSLTKKEEVLPCEFDNIHHPYYYNYKSSTFWPSRPDVKDTYCWYVFVCKDNKWGVYKAGSDKDDSYQKIIDTEYVYIWGMYPNTTIVHAKTQNNKFVLLDLLTGRTILEDVDDIKIGNDYYGYFPVKRNGLWGIFSANTGTITHDFKYKHINEFPLAKERNSVKVKDLDNKIGVVNPNVSNSITVPVLYDNVLYENGSFIPVLHGKKGICLKGKVIIPCEYNYVENVTKLDDSDFYIVQKFKNGKYGILDVKKNVTPEFDYDEIKIVNTHLKKHEKYNMYMDFRIKLYDFPVLLGLKNSFWDVIDLK